MTQASMTLFELHEFIRNTQREFFPAGSITLRLDSTDSAGTYQIFIRGLGYEGSKIFLVNSLQEIIVNLVKWTLEVRKQAQDKFIESLALSIIKLTAKYGHCSETALRMEGHSQAAIDAYGEAAVAHANKIAAPPFSILKTEGANS